jgi:hypothetical protein
MATNRNSFWFALFLLSAGFSFAQNINGPAEGEIIGSDREGNSFRVVETPQGLQIIQRLSWFRDENDFRYEVIVEKQNENGSYDQILREGRTENFIELSLSVGRYRYRVLVYNLLDRLEYSADWAVFSIDQARHPVLGRVRPDRFTLNKKGSPWVIELEGTNLLPESEISLRPLGGEGAAVKPEEYTAFPGGNGGRVVFHSADLAAGFYELRVRNPGGFEARHECLVKSPLSFDLFVSTSYTQALPVYGYFSDLFDAFNPLGVSVWADFLPVKKDWGAFGVETFVSWNYLSAAAPEASAHLLNFQLNLLYQYPLLPRLTLALRLGGGQALVLDLCRAGEPSVSTWIPSLDGGLSLKWIFQTHGFAELGFTCLNLFSVDGSQVFLLPFIGIGWKY